MAMHSEVHDMPNDTRKRRPKAGRHAITIASHAEMYGFIEKPSIEEFIGSGIRVEANGCWTYVPTKDGNYAQVHIPGGNPMALHRWVYELLVGPIPDGYEKAP